MMVRRQIVLVIVVLVAAVYSLSPVILVPGFGGSRISATLDKPSVVSCMCYKKSALYGLWLNLAIFTPLAVPCFADNIRLIYDNITRTTRNPPGVNTFALGFGDTYSVEWLEASDVTYRIGRYYAVIVEALVSWGYVRGSSVRAAPYDFRKAPNEMGLYFTELKHLIEDTYAMNNNSRVTLVGHSMGGNVILYYLNHQSQQWKDKYIHTFVSVSSPWGGAVTALQLFTSGYVFNYEILNPLHTSFRAFERTWPASAWFLPLETFWTPRDILVSQPARNYTVQDYQALFSDLQVSHGADMMEDTRPLTSDLKPPGVSVHCLHGVNVATPELLSYNEQSWPDGSPAVTNGDGDLTVNFRSLIGCLRWKGNQPQKVFHQVFPGARHVKLLFDDRLISYLKSLLISSQ